MLEKITDFFKEIRERMSSPLISSFIISWLIINWKIPIALLWYDYDELKVDGYDSYIDLIRNYYSPLYGFWLPLIISILYVGVIKNLTRALSAWASTWGTIWVLNISKEAKVPMIKYLQLRSEYQEQTKLLDELYGNESAIKQENEQLKQDMGRLEGQKNTLKESLDKWIHTNNPNILTGDWKVTHNKTESKARILAGSTLVYPDIRDTEKQEAYTLQHYFHNPSTARTCIIWAHTGDPSDQFMDLLSSDDLIFFSGVQVKFTSDLGTITGKRYEKIR